MNRMPQPNEAGARAWMVAVVLAAVVLFQGPAAAQPGYKAELSALGDVVLGDWYETTVPTGRSVLRIRLDKDGRFLSGRGADFGRFPSQWSAARTTLINQQTLTVRWPEEGECSYYVGFRVQDNTEIMVWHPYKDPRDLGPYDGVITRAIVPWGPCGPRTWSRVEPPAKLPDPLYPE